MRISRVLSLVAVIGIVSLTIASQAAYFAQEWKSGIKWVEPAIIDPGPTAAAPPSDAIVLFDGTDMSQFKGAEKWELKDGYGICKSGITTKEAFGDCQLHLEFASPDVVKGKGQGRGNSGVYFMGKYEVQILDSYENTTYYDGQCGAIYKQYPPLVNASRSPGVWQTYDIIFTAPRFNEDGSVKSKAALTVLHNGVVIQNHSVLEGGTFWHKPPSYSKHPERLPISIQFHGNPVKFRNIWIRELAQGPAVEEPKPEVTEETTSEPDPVVTDEKIPESEGTTSERK